MINDAVLMGAPDIREEDIDAVVAVLRSGMLTQGATTARFETAFAAYVGAAHAIAVNNGTAGLHLCVQAAGVGDGDEVITTPFSYVASANCALFERATPVFVDIDEQSMTIDPALVDAAVTDRTRAVLPVHVFGQACDLDRLGAICAARDIVLIEDACEAIGAEHRGQKIGADSRLAVFSFFPNKQMTTGEGAIITTNDEDTAVMLRSLRNQGRSERGAWLTHERLGYNYRMTEMSAALGVSQIARMDEMLASREAVSELYRQRLASIPGVSLMQAGPYTSRLSWFAAIIRLETGLDRDKVVEGLADRGIPSRAYFAPLHLQPYYRKRFGYAEGDFPVTERVARSTLALPFHNRLTVDEVEQVCDALAQVLATAGG